MEKTFCSMIFAAIIFMLVFSAGQVSAQDIRSDVSGFYTNLNLFYGKWSTSGQFLEGIRDYDPNGWGFQLSAGYGFNQRMEAFAQFSQSDFNMSGDWNTYTHTELGAGFRYNFGATLSAVRPFLDVQINSSRMEIDRIFVDFPGFYSEGDLVMNGISMIAGAGTRYFIRPWLAASLHVRYHVGMEYDLELNGQTLNLDEEQDLSQWDAGVGITWYFGKRF